jgi:hypothetical protein
MKLLGWIDSLVNRLATNFTLWIVGGVVVMGIVAYMAYSAVFIRLPQPPVYAKYVVLEPQRKDEAPKAEEPCPRVEVPKPEAYPKGEAPQPTPGPLGEPAAAKPGPTDGLPKPCPKVDHKLDEWSPKQRERYYQTSQGSLVMPWMWFRALEWRTGKELFASPAIQTRYGLLPDNDPIYNKDQMPVGIVKNIVADEYVPTLGEGEKEWASISCAACHTSQLLYKGTAMRIDGGQSFWNFDKWSGDMVFSLMVTSVDANKFERFCARVYELGEDGKCSDGAKTKLRKQMQRYFNSDLVNSAVIAILRHTYPTTEGFARTSALGRGVNGEFGPLDPCKGPLDRRCYRNVNMNTGPVSFPPLWYTHEYDWVQSSTSISQPLGRNVTEAWGVSVRVELNDPITRFSSTANIEDMFWMETLLSILQAPKWPTDILGPIDQDRAKRGEYLFNNAVWDKALPADQAELPASSANFVQAPNPNRPKNGYCARCHAPAFQTQPSWQAPGASPSPYKFLQLPLYRMKVLGTDEKDVMSTDPDDAQQFHDRQVYPGVLAPLFDKSMFDSQGRIGVGGMLTVTINGILNKWFKDQGIAGDQQCLDTLTGHRPNIFRAPVAYPARPLDGYWATGPFLHNGSVRTMYELLSPVEERAKSFWIGSREFDPVRLGFKDDPLEGAFLYDTTQKGNSNLGHEFRNAAANTPGVIGPWLTPEQRLDIIEYLKVLRSVQELLDSDPSTKDRLVQRNKLLDALSPFYEDNVGWWFYGKNKPTEREGGYSRMALCKAITAGANQAPSNQTYASPGSAPASPTPAKGKK